MIAEIITVGTEILLGDIVDTNSRYLSRQLAAHGITVRHHASVGDNPDRLKQTLRLALDNADLVVLSGGLGPTPDDLTKETVCALLELPLKRHEDSWFHIEDYFRKIGRPMTENNEKQAMLPVGCTVFPNEHGTAPGCAIRKGNKHVLLFPGPPRELKPMFEKAALPYLAPFFEGVILSHQVRVFGMGEAAAAEKAGALMEGTNPTVAPYAKDGEMFFRVTAKAETDGAAETLCRPVLQELRARLGDAVYGVDVENMQQATVAALRAAGKTVATAESCTAGLVAARLAEIPGASAVLRGGIVAYTPEMKQALLGVSEQTLAQYGAVSEQTAREMARGARERCGADMAVAVTGVAGPDPSEGKPVGTVFVAVADAGGEQVRALCLGEKQRDYIRQVAGTHALDLLRIHAG